MSFRPNPVVDHPMRGAVLAAQEQDPALVPNGFVQDGARHLYMKHMAQHMIDGFPLDWAEDCVNIHLIRHPARVIASYAAGGDKVKLFEVTRDKEIVWRYMGPHRVHHFQVLTTNGEPLEGDPLK